MKIPGMGNMMKQVQQMQEDMQRAEEELNNMEITGEAGAGLVKVTLNGRKECKKVSIDDSLLDDDKEILEDIIAAAFNAVGKKVDDAREEKMGGVTSGLKMPAGLDSFLK